MQRGHAEPGINTFHADTSRLHISPASPDKCPDPCKSVAVAATEAAKPRNWQLWWLQ